MAVPMQILINIFKSGDEICFTRAFRCLRTWSRELGSFVADSVLIVPLIASGVFVFGSCFIMQNLLYFLVLQYSR